MAQIFKPRHVEPCPFCGCKKIVFERVPAAALTESYDCSAKCPDCGCTVSVVYIGTETAAKSHITRKWNNRTNVIYSGKGINYIVEPVKDGD